MTNIIRPDRFAKTPVRVQAKYTGGPDAIVLPVVRIERPSKPIRGRRRRRDRHYLTAAEIAE